MPETIENAFEDSLKRIEEGKESIEECLMRYPQFKAELREMLSLALSLKSLGHSSPSKSFSQNAGVRLVSKLSDQQVTLWGFIRRIGYSHNPINNRRLKMAQILLTMVMVLSLVTGGVSAADNASPGDLLYGLDRSIEQIQLILTNNPDIIAEYRLEFAAERLQEAKDRLDDDDLDNALAAFEAYDNEISELAKLIADTEGIQQEALIAMLSEALSIHQEILTELLDGLPDEAQEAVQKALDVSMPAFEIFIESSNDLPSGLPENLPLEVPEEAPMEPPLDPMDAPPIETPIELPIDPTEAPPVVDPIESPIDPTEAPPVETPEVTEIPTDPPTGEMP